MTNYNDGSKFGYTCVYEDGTKVTNLSYLDSLELFDKARDTDNPCSIQAPGFGMDCSPENRKRKGK